MASLVTPKYQSSKLLGSVELVEVEVELPDEFFTGVFRKELKLSCTVFIGLIEVDAPTCLQTCLEPFQNFHQSFLPSLLLILCQFFLQRHHRGPTLFNISFTFIIINRPLQISPQTIFWIFASGSTDISMSSFSISIIPIWSLGHMNFNWVQNAF